MSCRLLCFFTALLGFAAAGCGRRAETPPRRIAILRFENTGGDPADDWMGRVLSEAAGVCLERGGAIQSDAVRGYDSVLGYRPAAVPGVSAERTQALLAGAGLLGYGAYLVRDGRVTARLTVQSAEGNRTVREISASGAAADLIGVAEALASGWSANAGRYPTTRLEAARAYAAAIEAPSPEESLDLLKRAAAADPAFAPAHLRLARALAARQDRAGAEAVLRAAGEHSGGLDGAWKARIDLELASLRADPVGRMRALDALATASPADPAVWRALGDTAFAGHDSKAAVAAYRKALAIEPGNTALLNQAGYALAASGEWKDALEMFGRYRALRPDDPNPLDSLGDVHLQAGRFQDAAGFYQEAYRKSPAFLGAGTLYKAAIARLLSGDVAGADAIAKQYMDARQAAGDPIVEYRKADWSWLSGRRREGYQRLAAWAAASSAGSMRDFAARAYAQLAIWNLALGRRDAAAELASRAGAPSGAASAGMVAMARFLTQPPASSAEWAARAERSFPENAQSAFRNFARAYALVFSKDFQNAVPLLREIYQTGAASDPGVPVLLAWACLETGRTAEAASLLAQYPIPSAEGSGVFDAMYLPRVLYLRGLLAERQGRAGEARASYRSFLQISGDQPLAWGEEPAAASKLK